MNEQERIKQELSKKFNTKLTPYVLACYLRTVIHNLNIVYGDKANTMTRLIEHDVYELETEDKIERWLAAHGEQIRTLIQTKKKLDMFQPVVILALKDCDFMDGCELGIVHKLVVRLWDQV